MPKFELPSFGMNGANSKKFVNNWDDIFSRENTRCLYNDTCKREAREGKEWCNFHLITCGQEHDKDYEEIKEGE